MNLMLKKILMIFIISLSNIVFGFAQNVQISLLTCDPGDQIYSVFGHSAIRVLDQETGEDLVYNYGTFDFDAPFFVVKFTQRTLDYMLSVTTYDRFLYEYQYFQRGVREQVLNLNDKQKEDVVKFLKINALPENRLYRYDFFYDNCATRVRDLFEEVLGKQLVWNDPKEPQEQTFRDLIDECIHPLPWYDLGIDLALGSVIDAKASEREKQFLPVYMEAAFARAQIEGDGPTRALAQASQPVLQFPQEESSASLFNPFIVMWLVAIIFMVVTFLGYKRRRLYVGFDVALFGVLGLLGLLIFVLWFLTFHSQTKWNWNILWAFPMHLVLVFALLKKEVLPWLKRYLMFALIMADAAVVFWILGWQSFHPSLIPILLVVILRTNFLYYNVEVFKRQRTNSIIS
ncbi:DUF4105 domain-containing protein [Belliella kenyensis]|uniref:DUF4105 domain-containing protein n=1 Tax=Belliella kenyensis TaxID=1472724 RepID=A0ABV8EK97_9BACT|nr:DUF4105 domain-containing protein [Belliella kenyensis]MCH7401312.1 DUF4105 domain-containing protein [Belliella kenyensis]MDN3602756.1 DUF4105 domain-containing protein [Belliella kenyensis]